MGPNKKVCYTIIINPSGEQAAVRDFHGYYTINNILTLIPNSGTFIGVCCKLDVNSNFERKKKKKNKRKRKPT